MFADHPDESTFATWMTNLRDGDREAVEKLWDRYFDSLVQVANRRLRNPPPNLVVDGEDIAASVIHCIWRGMQNGRFAAIRERDQLWWTLLRVTRQKCIDAIRKAQADCNGGNFQFVSLQQPMKNERELFDFVVTETPDAQYVAILEEEFQRLLSLLSDQKQRQIAVLRVEGYSMEEVAAKLNVSMSTVTRKLRIIRETWSRGGAHEHPTGSP